MNRCHALLLAAALGGCALFQPPPLAAGQSEAEVTAMLGRPTARYAMPSGRTRLEFARGPFGYETWMVDLDGAGKVQAFDQVLTELRFIDFQAAVPGMTPDEVLRAMGTPAQRRPGGLAGGEVWSWRYFNTECRWFQVTIDDRQRAQSATIGIDPVCDARRQSPGGDVFN